MHFLDQKFVHFGSDFTEICIQGSNCNWQLVNIGSYNGLAQKWQQAFMEPMMFSWTNPWCNMESLGHSLLTKANTFFISMAYTYHSFALIHRFIKKDDEESRLVMFCMQWDSYIFPVIPYRWRKSWIPCSTNWRRNLRPTKATKEMISTRQSWKQSR